MIDLTSLPPSLEALLERYDPTLLNRQHAEFDTDEPVGKEQFWDGETRPAAVR